MIHHVCHCRKCWLFRKLRISGYFSALLNLLLLTIQSLNNGNTKAALSAFNLLSSAILWRTLTPRYGGLFVLVVVLSCGLIAGSIDLSGCVLVALGIFATYGNHAAKYSAKFIEEQIAKKPANHLGGLVDIRPPDTDSRVTVAWEFVLVFVGTLIWGFGGSIFTAGVIWVFLLAVSLYFAVKYLKKPLPN